MATLKDFRDERLRKLNDLKEAGFNPYPADSHRTNMAGDLTSQFDSLQGKTATVAGRITAIRKFGKLAFIVIKDQSGSIQLFIQTDTIEPRDTSNNQLGIDDLPLLDTGDFIEVSAT